MKDFDIEILFFLEIILCVAIGIAFMVRFKLLKHCQAAAKESIIPFQNKDLPFYYSSSAVKQECLYKFFGLRPPLTTLLALKAIKTNNLKKRFELTKKHLQKHPANQNLRLLTAELALLCNEGQTFRHLIKEMEIPAVFAKHKRAKYNYLKANEALYETDLSTASALGSKALETSQKLGFQYEEASCYLLLMQIYRITGVFDVAETMLKEADKRFCKLKMNAKKAECTAYLGLISFGREQYDFAIRYLSDAAAIAKRYKLYRSYADINNWLGLSFYMNNKKGKAEKSFRIALKESKTSECTAYAAEMLARIRYQLKDYKNALKYVETALKASNSSQNIAGLLENLYIKAEIFFNTGNPEQSKKILTEIIKKKLLPSTPFYPANAYTLLGLIYLGENKLSKAKNLFKQAVDLEHGRNRLKGAAIDYNNLAEVARLEGCTIEAEQYLKQALAYAEKINDETLKSYLAAKLT